MPTSAIGPLLTIALVMLLLIAGLWLLAGEDRRVRGETVSNRTVSGHETSTRQGVPHS
jgi:uncharacterized protein (DUF58 family)